jgi:hypothetical protein
MSGQLHAPTALPPASIVHEAEQACEVTIHHLTGTRITAPRTFDP